MKKIFGFILSFISLCVIAACGIVGGFYEQILANGFDASLSISLGILLGFAGLVGGVCLIVGE